MYKKIENIIKKSLIKKYLPPIENQHVREQTRKDIFLIDCSFLHYLTLHTVNNCYIKYNFNDNLISLMSRSIKISARTFEIFLRLRIKKQHLGINM